MEMTNVLEADGVWVEFGNRRILSDIFLQCRTGAICGILGRNGCGKTTLFQVIFGSLEGRYQSVRINGVPHARPYQNPGSIAMLPQHFFIPKNLRISRVLHDYGLPETAFTDHFPEASTSASQTVGELSGGYRRLLEFFIVTHLPARFLLLDEPFSHIMPLHIEGVKEILHRQKEHKGILISDHQYEHVLEMSDTLYLLREGKLHRAKGLEDLQELGYVY